MFFSRNTCKISICWKKRSFMQKESRQNGIVDLASVSIIRLTTRKRTTATFVEAHIVPRLFVRDNWCKIVINYSTQRAILVMTSFSPYMIRHSCFSCWQLSIRVPCAIYAQVCVWIVFRRVAMYRCMYIFATAAYKGAYVRQYKIMRCNVTILILEKGGKMRKVRDIESAKTQWNLF